MIWNTLPETHFLVKHRIALRTAFLETIAKVIGLYRGQYSTSVPGGGVAYHEVIAYGVVATVSALNPCSLYSASGGDGGQLTVLKRNSPVKVREEDNLRVSLQVRQANGSHCH